MKILICFFTSLCLFLSPVWSQVEKVKIDAQAILEYIKILADDSMEGRKSGLPGARKAAFYIADKFKEWGLEPAGENSTYFQNFSLKDFFHVGPEASLEIFSEKKKKKFYQQYQHEDWRVCNFSGSGDFEAEIVVVGYGIHAPDKGYDDYSGIDITDKIALINMGYPTELGSKLYGKTALEDRVKAAQTLGAKGVMLYFPPIGYGYSHYPFPGSFHGTKEVYKPDFVIVGINVRILDFIFDELPTNLRNLFSKIEKEKKPMSFSTGFKAKISVKTEFDEKRKTFNVLGKIRGMDKNLKEEYIILSAHMDHMGITPENEVVSGAYDNASGTALVMEAARMMKLNGIKPKRTVIFALWAAEEQAPCLLGAKHYADHPLYPLEKTVVNLNLDCVGQGNGDVIFGGIYHSPELWEVLKKNLDKEALSDISPARGHGGGDHFAFLAKGVPAFRFVTRDRSPILHHPRDDWDLIKPEPLEKAGRFLYRSTLVFAQNNENLFFPRREEWILFKGQTLANFHMLPSSSVLENRKDVKNPHVNVQLIFPEEKKNWNSTELKLEIIQYLDSLPDKVKKLPGLVMYEYLPSPVRQFRQHRTRLIAGLKGSSSFRDDPYWLKIFSEKGAQFVLLACDDLGFEGNELSAKGKEIVQTANKARILLIVSGLNAEQQRTILNTSQKPLVLISETLPSQECLDLIKQKGHALALTFNSQEDATTYFEKLKNAKEKLGLGHLIAWNKECLWNEEIKAKYLDLFTCLIKDINRKEIWNPEASNFAAHIPDLSPIFSGTFLNILMKVKR